MIKPLGLSVLLMCSTVWADYVPPYSVESYRVQLHVDAQYRLRERSEVVYKVETDKGIAALGELSISYNNAQERVRVIEAYTLQPDGTKLVVTPDRIRTQDDHDGAESGIFSEYKQKIIIFPNLKVGSKTYYRVESYKHTPTFPGHFHWNFHFSPHHVYRQLEIELSHDPRVPITVQTQGMSGGPAASSPRQKTYRLRFSQDQAHPPESSMVDAEDFAPFFAASTYPRYAEVAKAYHARAHDKARPTPEVMAQARQIVGEASTETEKVRRLYEWVSRHIRYLGVFGGSGGHVPHPASRVLKQRYGDCKDHATLLEAMLSAVGIESSPALIQSGRSYRLPELPTPDAFNHVITYVPSLKLFLDSTSRYTPMGELPWSVMGKSAVLTKTGEVINTPLDTADRNRNETQTQLTLHPDGRVSGESRVTLTGYLAISSREKLYHKQGKPREEVINDMLNDHGETGTGAYTHPDPFNRQAPWVVQTRYELDPSVNLPGVAAMTIPVGLSQGRLQNIALSRPIKPTRFGRACSSSSHDERIEIQLSPELQISHIPPNIDFNSPQLRYEARYSREGDKLLISRKLRVERGRMVCTANDDVQWSELIKVLRADMRGQVFLSR